MKAGTIARWVRSGQVVELYDLATGAYIGEIHITAGKAKFTLPRGLGVQVRDAYCATPSYGTQANKPACLPAP